MKNSILENIIHTKNYLESFLSKKFSPEYNSNIYLASNTNSVGNFFLKKIFKIKNDNSFKNIFLDVIYGLKISGKIIKNNLSQKKFSKIIFSWGFKNNFLNDGSFNDRYFGINSSDKKNFLWFIIYMDKKIPNKIDDNIVIFKVYDNFFYNILTWIKFILLNTINIFKGIDFFLHNISSSNFLSKKLINSSKKIFLKDFNEILFPYEGQPFQNEIIRHFRNNKNKVKITGYIHAPPMAVPTNFIYKYSSPDRIFLCGSDQKFCFEKILGWPKDKIVEIPSLRFKQNVSEIENSIFLPNVVNNQEKILDSLIYIHDNIKKLHNFKIRNHPASFSNKRNIELINKIKNLFNIKASHPNIFEKKLIFIGNSGAIIESLERGYDVVQICENFSLEYYSKNIWKSIESETLGKDIFTYKLKEKGNLISFGDANTNIDTILNYDK